MLTDIEKDLDVSGKEKTRKTESAEFTDANWEEEFEWKSPTQHVIFFLIYLLEWNTFFSLLYEDEHKNPYHDVTFLHYFILIIILGCPLVFMQNFIGQYTRKGPFVIGEMMPIAYGIGYTITSNAFFDFVIQYFYTIYYLFFVIVCFNNEHGPWEFCNDQYYAAFPNCFSHEDIDWCPTLEESDEPCFSPEDKILPGTIYLHYIGLDRLHGSKEIDDMYPPTDEKIFYLTLHAIVIFICIIIVSGRSLRNFEVFLKFALAIIIACILALLVIIFTQSGGLLGIKAMFAKISFEAMFSIRTWGAAFRRLVAVMKLGVGGHILFGSFVPVTDLSPYRAVYLCSSFFVTITLFFTFFFLFQGLLIFKFNLTLKDLHLNSEQGIIFVFFPYLLGVQAFGFFFYIIYFVVLLLLNFCCLNIKLLILEKIISTQFKITGHLMYIKYGILITANLLCIIIELPIVADNLHILLHEYNFFVVATLFLQLIIVLLYGIQRFSDDVHFFLHVKVSLFVKVCWIMAPLICLLEIVLDTLLGDREHLQVSGLRLIVFSFCYVPVMISLCKVIFHYAKNKNLIGLLRPMDSYGPPTVIQRIYRILYNPRLTVRYKQQLEACHHECLLHSIGLEKAIQEEIRLIEKLAKAVEVNMSGKIYHKVGKRLKLHCELLKDEKTLNKIGKIYSLIKTPTIITHDTGA